MIKEVEIKDFEAHENTMLRFGPGLNVIHGRSNQGKSASLRAIELPAYGSWAAGENKKKGIQGPVRIGAKNAEIKVTSDKGYVTVKKGKKINEWLIHNNSTGESLELQNPGAGSIPQAQEVLGLKSIEVAGSQIRFNWSDQRDKHFLIDEVEGKSSTPSFVAAVLDEVGGLSGCEELIRNIASDKTSFEKTMREASEQITEVESDLRLYDGLEDRIEALVVIKSKVLRSEELQQTIVRIRDTAEKINNVKENLSHYRGIDECLEKTNMAIEKIEQTEEMANKRERSTYLNKSIKDIQEKLDNVETFFINSAHVDIDKILGIMRQIERLKDKQRSVINLSSKIKSLKGSQVEEKYKHIDFQNLFKQLTVVERKAEKQERIISFFKKYLQQEEKRRIADKECLKARQQQQLALDNYEELLETMEFCPTCGQKISSDCKQEMIEGV